MQPGTLVHVPGEVGHVMKTILCLHGLNSLYYMYALAAPGLLGRP